MKHHQEPIGKKGTVTYLLQSKPDPSPLIIVLPGGGYAFTSSREGLPVAEAFHQAGYSAIVLDYSTEGLEAGRVEEPVSKFPQPLIELASLIKHVRQQSQALKIDASNITVIGFSAGANLACQLAAYHQEAWLLDQIAAKPADIKVNQYILAYPPINDQGLLNQRNSQYYQSALGNPHPSQEEIQLTSPLESLDETMPATFIWTTGQDQLVDPINSLQLACKLHELGVPFELHLFQPGEHGLSLATADIASRPSQIQAHVAQWFPLALSWLQELQKSQD